MRKADTRLKYTKSPNIGYSRPDSMYVVDLYEDAIKIGFIQLPNKSRYYADAVVKNWENGILKESNEHITKFN